MTPDELRLHINRLSPSARYDVRALRRRISAACWPGGPQDRTERTAVAWLRRWRPERAGVPLPRCSCAGGHCAICN